MKGCPPKAWTKITTKFKEMQVAGLLTEALPIQRESDSSLPPLVSREEIQFNGIGQDGHETMYVTRVGGRFNFCKTAYKPYDTVVVALLCLMEHCAPDVWVIGSDGNKLDWLEGLALAMEVEPECKLPPGIRE